MPSSAEASTSSSPPRASAPRSPPTSPSRSSLPRSISYGSPRSPPSSSRPLITPQYSYAGNEEGSAHASSSYHSSSGLATRTRSRSVGSKSRDNIVGPLQEHAQIGQALDRGPGTPDFTLEAAVAAAGASPTKKSPKGKGRLQDLIRDGGDAAGGPTAPMHDGKSRPRLTTRLRSFFTSMPGHDDPLLSNAAEAGPSKARTSNELARDDAAPYLRPSPLVVPAARQAGVQPFGLHGLNDDSPPLTPTSEEGYDARMGARQKDHHRWPTWAPNGTSESMLTPPLTSSTPATSRTDSPTLYAPTAGHQASMSLGTGGALAADGLLPRNIVSHGAPITTTPRRAFSLHDLTAHLEAGLRSRSLRQHMPTLLMLLTFFVFSTLVVVLLLTTLPLRMPSHSLTQLSLSEMRDVCHSLRDYASSNAHAYHHTLFVLCLFFTYKQAFNIPGSIVSNIVFGALFGTWRAALWLSLFTAVGGSGAAIMSALVAPLVLKMPGMTKAVGMMRKALGGASSMGRNGSIAQRVPLSRRGSRDQAYQQQQRRRHNNRSATPSRRQRSVSPYPARHNAPSSKSSNSSSGNLYSILLLLRVLPLTPYGVMNVACGILNVPLLPFATTLALGSLPWNAVTAQLGEVLVEVVAALPMDGGLPTTSTLGSALDSGGFHDAASPAVMHDVLTSEKLKLSSAAHKAGGGLKILMAKIWTREMLLKLVGLSMLSLAPVLLGRWWKARQASLARKRRQEAAEGRAREVARAVGAKRRHNLQVEEGEGVGVQQQSGLAMPTAGTSSLPSWINSSSDDDASGLEEGEGDGSDDPRTWAFNSDFDEDDDEGDYSGSDAEEDDASGSTGSPFSSPTSSSTTFGSFAASVAEKTSHVGPALIASLTRSASRNSWTNGVLRGSSGSAAPASSSSPQGFRDAWLPTGEQAANGNNPYQSATSSPATSSFLQHQGARTSSPPTVSHGHARTGSGFFRSGSASLGPTTPQLELAQSPFGSFDTRVHPTIDVASARSSPVTTTRWHTPAHSRQVSAASPPPTMAQYQQQQGGAAGAAPTPKRLRGVVVPS